MGKSISPDEPLVWHTEKRKWKDLIPYDKNPRYLTEKQAAELQKSIERFNVVDIPAIDTDGTLVGGHARLKIIKTLQENAEKLSAPIAEEIDVRVPNRKLTPAEFQELNLRLNRNGGMFDYELLSSINLDTLRDIGFEEWELMRLPQEATEGFPQPMSAEDDQKIPDVDLKGVSKETNDYLVFIFKDKGEYERAKTYFGIKTWSKSVPSEMLMVLLPSQKEG